MDASHDRHLFWTHVLEYGARNPLSWDCLISLVDDERVCLQGFETSFNHLVEHVLQTSISDL